MVTSLIDARGDQVMIVDVEAMKRIGLESKSGIDPTSIGYVLADTGKLVQVRSNLGMASHTVTNLG